MVIGLILAVALQAGSQPLFSAPVCSLVTPGNHLVGFRILPGTANGQVSIVPTQGSIWPRQVTVATGAVEGSRFAFAGEQAFVLTLERAAQSDRRIATMAQRVGQRDDIPVAFGFCGPSGSPATDQASTGGAAQGTGGVATDPFDPRHWPEDRCGMLLSNGRRLPFNFQLTGLDEVAMVSTGLWNGRSVTARSRSATSFSGRNGLSGSQELIVREREGIAVKLIRFRNLGDPTTQGHTAYAICGYGLVVRRPAPR